MAAAPTPRLLLNRAQRLKQNREFNRVRQAGKRLVHGCLIANWLPLPTGSPTRLGVVTSGKIGGAIIRNRARRLLREAFRQHQHEFTQPLDLVLVARNSIVGRDFAGVEKDFLTAAQRAGILKTS